MVAVTLSLHIDIDKEECTFDARQNLIGCLCNVEQQERF